jgi:RNA polymerase sigma factor (sigma-70 family)
MSQTSRTDEELFAASRAGGVAAFARLVERYQSLVCAVSYGATGDRVLSEDIAQDTFVAAWNGLSELREASKFRSWLCGIARNLSLKALKRRGREVPSDVEVQAAVNGLENNPPSPLDDILSRESEELVWAALALVPQTYRETLILFYREEQSTRQVATVLGLSEDAVHKRLSRGRHYLKESVARVVERTLEKSKPAGSLAPLVLAAIAGQAAIGSAEAASPTAVSSASTKTASLFRLMGAMTMKKLAAAAGIAAILALLTTVGVAAFEGTFSERGRESASTAAELPAERIVTKEAHSKHAGSKMEDLAALLVAP